MSPDLAAACRAHEHPSVIDPHLDREDRAAALQIAVIGVRRERDAGMRDLHPRDETLEAGLQLEPAHRVVERGELGREGAIEVGRRGMGVDVVLGFLQPGIERPEIGPGLVGGEDLLRCNRLAGLRRARHGDGREQERGRRPPLRGIGGLRIDGSWLCSPSVLQ